LNSSFTTAFEVKFGALLLGNKETANFRIRIKEINYFIEKILNMINPFIKNTILYKNIIKSNIKFYLFFIIFLNLN